MNCPIIVHDWLPEPMLEHEIRLRAYYLFVRRGKREGYALTTGSGLRTKSSTKWNLTAFETASRFAETDRIRNLPYIHRSATRFLPWRLA